MELERRYKDAIGVLDFMDKCWLINEVVKFLYTVSEVFLDGFIANFDIFAISVIRLAGS